jgi:hypothetical protein
VTAPGQVTAVAESFLFACHCRYSILRFCGSPLLPSCCPEMRYASAFDEMAAVCLAFGHSDQLVINDMIQALAECYRPARSIRSLRFQQWRRFSNSVHSFSGELHEALENRPGVDTGVGPDVLNHCVARCPLSHRREFNFVLVRSAAKECRRFAP